MPALNLDLESKADDEIGAHAQAIFNAMDGKAKYATVQALVTAMLTAKTAYGTALTEQETAAGFAVAKTQAKNDTRTSLQDAITALGNAMIATNPPFSEADLLEALFTLRAAGSPIGPLPAPVDFLATMGDAPGEMDLTWSAIKGRRYYDVEYRLVTDTNWTRLDPSPTKSKAEITGLQSGKEYIFRVRAVGTAGATPWSDVSIKMAP